jgi:cation transport ATPase
LGLIALADTLKPDSIEAVRLFKKQGKRVVILTGDNMGAARHVAALTGADEVFAGLLPADKERIIRDYEDKGVRTMMVGDGINDAPSLTRAFVGVALSVGTDIAIEAADVVISGGSLMSVVTASDLSRKTLRNIKQNLFWAFFYNAVCIPLAAGAFVALGVTMDPMYAAAAMSLSSVFVVLNALRLKLYRPPLGAIDNKNKADNNFKEEKDLKTEIKIEGMMCAHCASRVQNALKAAGAEAKIDLKRGVAETTDGDDISDEALKAAVEGAGYKVTGIRRA